MKFIWFYLQFINSLECLGMFFSSATLVRRLRRYAIFFLQFYYNIIIKLQGKFQERKKSAEKKEKRQKIHSPFVVVKIIYKL